MATVTSANREEFNRKEMEKRGMLSKHHPQPNINDLKREFDAAIAYHRSLPTKERVANSKRAAEIIGQHVGRNKEGKVIDLLSQNRKLQKAGGKGEVEMPDGRGVETTGLSLSPAYEEGKFNTCPNSKSCKKECLGKTSGGYFQFGGGRDLEAMLGPRLANFKKTQALLRNPREFATRLYDQIQVAKTLAEYEGNHLGVRLNVLSDLHPKMFQSLMEAHPDVTFYDYTKNNSKPVAPNHHLTYSSTGVSQPAGHNGVKVDIDNEHQNWHSMRNKLEQGQNVAMAFSHSKAIPETVHDEETGKKYKVISGDEHDFRPLDEKGVIVGLARKAATHGDKTAAKNSNGFFVHYEPQFKMEGGKQVKDEEGNPIATNKEVRIAKQKRGNITLNNNGEAEK